MHECLNKTFSQNCLHGEIAFSNSTCIDFVITQDKKKEDKKKLTMGEWYTMISFLHSRQ